jgi:hypothetical protein
MRDKVFDSPKAQKRKMVERGLQCSRQRRVMQKKTLQYTSVALAQSIGVPPIGEQRALQLKFRVDSK